MATRGANAILEISKSKTEYAEDSVFANTDSELEASNMEDIRPVKDGTRSSESSTLDQKPVGKLKTAFRSWHWHRLISPFARIVNLESIVWGNTPRLNRLLRDERFEEASELVAVDPDCALREWCGIYPLLYGTARVMPASVYTLPTRDGLAFLVAALDCGADPNHLSSWSNHAPLHLAASGTSMDVLTLLLSKGGGRPNLPDRAGDFPISIAVERGSIAAMQVLESYGADLSISTRSGMTPLMAACRSNRFEVVEYLLVAGVDVYARYETGETAAHVAGRNLSTECLCTLQQWGVNCSERNGYAYSPIQLKKNPRLGM